eukprot:TRINITY_DN318_c1_g1_i1.p1 TRINITY_DN318_c1_g1~~TRINITY_DN318_c1_g1_i1.p1  ORF type:complete len:1285 (-),score=355.00 TRINITY_DN318_c1_g1_i1:77-3880(-)
MENMDEELSSLDDEEVQERDSKRPRLDPSTLKEEKDEMEVTAEELSALKETENIFHSNIFSLQMKELLHETTVTGFPKSLEETLKNIKSTIESMPQRDINSQDYLSKYPSVHLRNPKEDISFKFFPPFNTLVVGSFLLKTQTRPHLNVDMVIEIPAKCVKPRDIKCYRYFDKRWLYLAVVAEGLIKSGSYDVEFSTFRNDIRKPMLVVHPKDKQKRTSDQSKTNNVDKFVINLIPGVKQGLTKSANLLPNVHNATQTEGEDEQCRPTPSYNMAIVEDMMFDRHLQLLNRVLSQSEHFKEAIVLLKVWLHQRGMVSSNPTSFNGFFMSMLMVHLFQVGILDLMMMPDLIFRTVLKFISEFDWHKDGIYMKNEKSTKESDPDTVHDIIINDEIKLQYRRSFPVVFVDPSGRLNLTWRMNDASWSDLVHECKITLNNLLGNTKSLARGDAFEMTFMKKVSFHLKYDGYLKVSFPENKSNVDDKLLTYEQIPPAVSVLALLKQGYGDRIRLITSYQIPIPTWKLDKNIPPSHNIFNTSVYGLLFNPSQWKRLVDQGPPAEDTEAVGAFKKLWGSKAQIRRFRDGKIIASTVWSSPGGLEHRHHIMAQIAQHLIETHFGASSSSSSSSLSSSKPKVEFELGYGFLDKIAIPDVSKYFDQLNESGEQATNDFTSFSAYGVIQEKWHELVAKLDLLRDLPLKIRTVELISPVYKYTDPCPPTPHPYLNSTKKTRIGFNDVSPFTSAIHGVIQFASSGAWPNDLNAINKIKTAFYISLSDAVQRQLKIRAFASHQYIDIYYVGYVFRLVIYHPNEVLLQCKFDVNNINAVTALEESSSTTKSSDPTESLSTDNPAQIAVKNTKNEILMNPLHRALVSRRMLAGSIHALHLRNPSYGPCVRLLHRWLASHMLLPHYHYELLELLVASVYTSSAGGMPYDPPTHFLSGFLRVLDLLANFDWKNEPLVVEYSESDQIDYTNTDYPEIRKSYEHLQNLPSSSHPSGFPPQLFVANPHDKFCSIWTRDKPTPVIFQRTVALAKQSSLTLSQHFQSILLPSSSTTSSTSTTTTSNFHSLLKWENLFSTSLHDYDLILWLNPAVLPHFQKHTLQCKKLTSTSSSSSSQSQTINETYQKTLKTDNVIQDYKRNHIGKKNKQQQSQQQPNNNNNSEYERIGGNNILIDFDPGMLFFRQLQERFGSMGLFSYDPYCNVIGVIWNPTAFLPSNKFQLQKSINTMPITGTNPQFVPNIFSIINEMKTFGEGVLSNIEFVKSQHKIKN